MRKSMLIWGFAAMLILMACSNMPTATQPTAPATQAPINTVVVVEAPTSPAVSPYPAPMSTAYPNTAYPAPGQLTPEPTSEINEATMRAMSELARQKLAEELEISVDQIKVVIADPTYWSDTSLGCPQPGMTYQQVITPGYRITLAVGSDLYVYHTDTVQTVIRCQR
ncbi:MAG: hypothetical protein NZ699_00610 [Roseiflexus sp.]|nr:hypothetical protein [Roseiflexus sp.]MCS7287611.1 hypothetical protein [Roseiflexus sp.]MDW8147715.1 hypothetical protein [Roseiflexaceae bacterium]MDW8233642.1 hypothetical protein [Roseiflexaceae bacterium]